MQNQNHRMTIAIAGLLLLVSGCHLRPNFGPPGTIGMQRDRAVLHDPFPSNDLGPTIVGGRPKGFDIPRAEAVDRQDNPFSHISLRNPNLFRRNGGGFANPNITGGGFQQAPIQQGGFQQAPIQQGGFQQAPIQQGVFPQNSFQQGTFQQPAAQGSFSQAPIPQAPLQRQPFQQAPFQQTRYPLGQPGF